MRKRKTIRWLALLAAAALLGGCSAPNTAENPVASVAVAEGAEKTSATGFYFDTVVTFGFYGADATLGDDLLAACERYEKLLSKTVEGSDVWNLNHANGEAVTVDSETWSILKRAKEISETSGGAFTVTIAPLSALWDFTGGTQKMPTEEERLAALPLAEDSKLELLENSAVRIAPGMMIDLGGIAKGYIADQLAQVAAPRCMGATLNFGGNVYTVGSKPENAAFRLGITDPQHPQEGILGVVTGKNITVVTSGTYERYFVKDGVTYHHILNPETGLPSASGLISATIIGKSSMDADAFATACIVLGREKALDMLNRLSMDAVLVEADGGIYLTDGLTEHYQIDFTDANSVRK